MSGKLLKLLSGGLMKSFSWMFDQGSASSVSGDTEYTIVPIKHLDGKWLWWGIKNNNLANKRPKFIIAKADHFSLVANERIGCWATQQDTDTWNDFSTMTIGTTNIELQHSSAFPSGMIYISPIPMYPVARVKRKVTEWIANAKVSDTPSSTSGIIGYMTARSSGDGTGRTASALPYYGFKITNDSGFTKNKAIVTAYNHGNESSGAYCFEAFIDWLLAGSNEAKMLLDYFEFYAYPMLNPQGVECGYFRSCPQDTTKDHNRFWNTTGTFECIDAFKVAFAADAPDIEVGIDFHGSADNTKLYANCNDKTVALYASAETEFKRFDANFFLQDSVLADSLRGLWISDYSPALALTLEMGGSKTYGIPDWKTSGQNMGKALTGLLSNGKFTNSPSVGSRSFNGTTDRIDWSNQFNTKAKEITISVWVYFSRLTGDQYIFRINDAGTSGLGIYNLNTTTGGGSFQLTKPGSTNLLKYSAGSTLSTGAWIHLLATHDGTHSDHTKVHLYKDGIEVTYGGGVNGANETEQSGTYSIGGRTADDIRNLQGYVSHLALWNRILSAEEISGLAYGLSPSFYPTDMKFYAKLSSSSLINEVNSSNGTADGTSFSSTYFPQHIIYP